MAVQEFYFFGSYNTFRPFILTVDSGADARYTIPTTGGGYNYSVNTSDGQTFNGVTGSQLIMFPLANTLYDIEIRGLFPRIFVDTNAERLKGEDVKQWGDVVWESMNRAFYGCANLQVSATDTPDLSNVTDTFRMFYNCQSLAPFNVSAWDVSNVTNMREMFFNCYLWDNNLNNWNVSSLVNANQMFRNSGFTNEGGTLDWSDAVTGSVNLENAHAFAYNTGLLGYKLQAGNIDLYTNNNFTNSATLTELIGMKTSFYIADAPITGSAIDNLFTSLGTANTGATITLRTAQNASGIDTTIATLKGWTIIIV